MKGSNGMPSRSLAQAIRYRELRAHRMLYIGALMLMVLPATVQVVGGSWTWNAYTPTYLKDIVLSFAKNDPTLIYFSTIIAGLFAIGLVWSDRGHGDLDWLLEGPAPRRQIFLTKVLCGISTIIAAYLWILAAMGITVLSIHKLELLPAVLERSLLGAAVGVFMFMIIISLTSAIGSVVLTVIAAGLASMIPQSVALVYRLVVVHSTITIMQENIYTTLQQFSPLPPDYPTGSSQLIFTAVFAGFAYLLGRLGLRWWSRAALERFHEPFLFPWLWNVFYAFLAVISGLFVDGIMALRLQYSQVWIFVAAWGGLAVVLWFVWRRLIWWLGKTALGWGPGAEF